MSSRLRAAENLVRQLAQDFGVREPELRVVPDREAEKRCGVTACACYNYLERSITISETCLSLGPIIHEFKHHAQFLEAGEDPDRAYAEFGRPHCNRPHEAEAKQFELAFRPFYIWEWERVEKGR